MGELILPEGIEPYYHDRDAGIVLYCRDNRDLLPELETAAFDLVLTDPPYGVGTWSSTGGHSLPQCEVDEINRWDIAPSPETLRECVRVGRYAVLWGGNYYADILGPCRSPLVWDKGLRGLHLADGEMAWTNFDFGTLRIFDFEVYRSDSRGNRKHPTQKPVALMDWCIQKVKHCRSVLDPYAGSGTTLVAAKLLGIPAVGIELEERYCAIAVNRLRQSVLPLHQPAPVAEQLALEER